MSAPPLQTSSPSDPALATRQIGVSPLKPSKGTWRNLRHLWTLLQPHRRTFLLAMSFLVVGSAVNLLFPQLARIVTNKNAFDWIVSNPFLTAVLIVMLFALQGVAFHGRTLLFGAIGHRVVSALRERLFSQLLFRSVEFFDQQRSSDLVSRIIADCAQIQDAVSIKLSVLLRYGLQVVVGVMLMATITPRLTLVLLLGLPVLVLTSMLLGKRLKKLSKELQRLLGVTSTIAEEVFSGTRVIKAFQAESLEAERFRRTNEQVLAIGIARASWAAFFSSFVNFLMNVFLVLVVLYGVLMVAHQQLSVGDLTAFLLYAAIVGVSFAFLVGTYVEFVQAMGGAARVFELLEESSQGEQRKPTSTAVPVAEARPEPVRVEFSSVSFAYPSRPDTLVLRDVSFVVEPGSSVALVGPSGAGKSSIVSLLLGFYPPQVGAVLINQTKLLHDSPASQRGLMTYVPQDPTLFGMSLRENLRLGNPRASEKEMREVLDELGLSPLIESLPQGLDTLPGDRALQLSGGQRQRVALARALLRDAGLLILDEATSSFDSETEERIQGALARRRHGRTLLVIAHRLSTVRHADQIIVLNQGAIVQRGSHETLMTVPGLYRSLVERQELRDK